jgi:uncharacterized membrane protein HdeD (DUF308 family)
VDDRLDMRIKASAVETAHRVAPWRPDIAWWVVGIQGVVALVLGLWLLLNQGAGEPVLAVLGLALLVIASVWAWSAMRSDLPQVVLGWRGLRGGAGIAVGAIVVADFVVDFLALPATLIVLALGLLISGLFGAAEWLVGRTAMAWRWPSLAGSAVSAVFGAILLISRLQAAPIFLQVVAGAAIVAGVLLLVRAGLLVRELRLIRAMPPSSEASSAPTPVTQASAGRAAPTVTVRSAGAPKPPTQEPPSPSGSASPPPSG